MEKLQTKGKLPKYFWMKQICSSMIKNEQLNKQFLLKALKGKKLKQD